MTAKHKIIVLCVLLAIIIAGTIYYFFKKKKIKEKVVRINYAIDSGVGLLGTDVDSVLLNVLSDNSYVPKSDDLKLMNSDKADTIIKAFAGKSKPQIKKMISSYVATYGQKFNDHLNDSFSSWFFPYDADSYAKVLNAIVNA